jgi:DNA-directed RNA polymerase subunit E'/Rpb7
MQYYETCRLSRFVGIGAKYIGKDVLDTLVSKLEDELGGKCISEGYVRPKSLRLEKVSIGKITHSGDVNYDVTFSADVLFPREGAVYEAKITDINKMGVLAGLEHVLGPSPLKFIVPRDIYVDDPYFQSLKVDDVLQLKTVAQNFQYGNASILVIAQLIPPEPPAAVDDDDAAEADEADETTRGSNGISFNITMPAGSLHIF